MTKDSIKISQEINFNGLPTWVSIGATLLPEDNVIESLRSLQKDITDYQTQEQQAYSKSKWAAKDTPECGPVKSLTEELEACATYADIQSFRFTVKNDAEKDVYKRKLEELSPKN